MECLLADGSGDPSGPSCRRLLRTLEIPGFTLCEAVWDAASIITTRADTWAMIGLTIEGGCENEWEHARVRCSSGSLLFHAPGQAHSCRISGAGSHSLVVAIDPAVLQRAADALPNVSHLRNSRRAPPHWLLFHLHRELALGDDLSAASVENTVFAILAELSERPGFEVRGEAPQWLRRVQEQIDEEFRWHHTLQSLAHAVGVHRVHLAREFPRRFGCTVGHYIRQRRVEVACHRLSTSRDSLSEIALDVGFADQSHFTNTFRRLVGVSPGVFRARFFERQRQLAV